MSKQAWKKIALVAVLAAAFVGLYSQFSEYASLDYIKEQQSVFRDYYAGNQAVILAAFFVGYVAVTALSLPGAAIMTLLAGALFGLVVGAILVSFASSIGATLAFLVARFVLGESLQEKYADKLKKINEGIAREGNFYLFTMRLIPVFPFFLINILMGVTKLPALSFYWVSQAGMLPGTIVYVFAGTQLADIESLGDIVSPGLLVAFVALGMFPLAAKRTVEFIRRRRAGAAEGGE